MQNLTIYKQIYPKQCGTLSKLGYASVINIRPDNEEEKQPTSQRLQHAANQCGLCYAYLPFTGERLNKVTTTKFAQIYHDLPKPILMFCGSGQRAKLLYQSALVQNLL